MPFLGMVMKLQNEHPPKQLVTARCINKLPLERRKTHTTNKIFLIKSLKLLLLAEMEHNNDGNVNLRLVDNSLNHQLWNHEIKCIQNMGFSFS